METLHIQDLIHLRKIKSLSQKELAHRTGIVRTTLSRIESGRIRPSRDEVRWIAEALGVPEAEVMAVLERTNTVLWTPKSERRPLSRIAVSQEYVPEPVSEFVSEQGYDPDSSL